MPERPSGPPLFPRHGYAEAEYGCPAPRNSTASIASFPSSSGSSGSSRGSSRYGSISSQPSRKSSYGSSVASSPPPTHSDARSFDVWQARHVLPQPTVSSSSSSSSALADVPAWHLPCEFRWLNGCDAVFALGDLDNCVDHVQEHFQSRRPPRVSCWWCDDFDFVDDKSLGETAFYYRMAHIMGHVRDGDYRPGTHPPRPDFDLLDFLWTNRLIGEDVYRRERGRSEVPLPRGMMVQEAPGRGPDGQRSRDGVIHDMATEERRRKREIRRGK